MITRIKKHSMQVLLFKLSLLLGIILMLIINNVSNTLTEEDKAIFKTLGYIKPSKTLSFEEELSLIKEVQFDIFQKAPVGEGIAENESREPADLMRNQKGMCYDRSRTFDKVFQYLGFETRHVYLLYKQNKPFYSAISHYGQQSHAVTEVKTVKGWMMVDSNTPWVAVTKQGEPVNADDVWRRFAEFDHAPTYLNQPWWALRGVYSRKGQFYGGFLVFPEININDFFSWLILRQ